MNNGFYMPYIKVSHKFPGTFDKKYFIVNGNLYNHLYYFHLTLCQMFNSTTIALSRFWGINLSTPDFDNDFQRIEGSAAAKEVDHGAT